MTSQPWEFKDFVKMWLFLSDVINEQTYTRSLTWCCTFILALEHTNETLPMWFTIFPGHFTLQQQQQHQHQQHQQHWTDFSLIPFDSERRGANRYTKPFYISTIAPVVVVDVVDVDVAVIVVVVMETVNSINTQNPKHFTAIFLC